MQAANEIDDQGDLRAILGELANDRPADDGLFAAMEQAMDRAAQFISDQRSSDISSGDGREATGDAVLPATCDACVAEHTGSRRSKTA